MTSTRPPRPRLMLKVNSPSPVAPPVEALPTRLPAPTVAQPKSRKGLIAGTIALSLVGIGMIPTNFEVGGAVKLQAKQGNQRSVTAPFEGVIERIAPNIQPGVEVQQGQPIAYLRSRKLEQEIAQVQQELITAQQQLEEQRHRFLQAQARVQTEIAQGQALAEQAQLATELAQYAVPSQVQEIEAKVHAKQADLAFADKELQRYEALASQGAIARVERDRRQRERNAIAEDMQVLHSSLAVTQQKLTNDVRGTEIQISKQSAVIAAEQKTAAEQQSAALGNRAIHLQQRLAKLQQDQKSLALVAPISGVVISLGFDLKVGKELKPEQPEGLLTIANLKDGLTGTVAIEEQDAGTIRQDQPVRLRLTSNKLTQVNAKVVGIIPNVDTDQTQQKHTVPVLIRVDNPDGQLANNSSGFAYVHSKQVRLYERVWREAVRLFAWERV